MCEEVGTSWGPGGRGALRAGRGTPIAPMPRAAPGRLFHRITPMKNRPRRLLFVLVGLAVVVGGLVVAVKLSLRSHRAVGFVVARLEEAYGAGVAAEGVDAGVGGSAVRGLKLYE